MRKTKEMKNSKNLRIILKGNCLSKHEIIATHLDTYIYVLNSYIAYSIDIDNDQKITKSDWLKALQNSGAKVTM